MIAVCCLLCALCFVPVDGEQKDWGCKWFDCWMRNVKAAVAEGHVLEVVYFAGEVGQGKVVWGNVTAESQLRDAVMAKRDRWAMIRGAVMGDDEAAFIASLSAAERHCLCGLGGSQKAEVAWLDEMGYGYEELDVSTYSGGSGSRSSSLSSSSTAAVVSKSSPMHMTATEWLVKIRQLLKLIRELQQGNGFLSAGAETRGAT